VNLFVTVPSLIRAGAEIQAVSLANGLSTRSNTVHLCSLSDRNDLRDRIGGAVTVHTFPRRSKFDRAPLGHMRSVVDEARIDVILGVMQFAAMVSWLASIRTYRKPPVVVGIHTTINVGLKEELQDRLIYRQILRRLAGIVFVCQNQREHWLRKFPELEGSAHVIYNGIDLDRYRRDGLERSAQEVRDRLEIPADATVFTCVAAFRPEKGHEILLRSFSRLDVNAYLILVGDGVLRERITRTAEQLGINDRLRLVGNIPDVRPTIVASDATVLASTSVETFSLAMLESMALGVPMIATRIGGASEAIQNHENGLLCAPGDVGALAGHLRWIVEHRSEARSLGFEAARTARQRFGVDSMIANYDQVLGDIAKEGGLSRRE
jgi:glycosyltransferase involved in cell wall biosynthesis